MKPAVLLATSVVLGLGSALPAWATCPVINGTYVRDVELEGGGARRYRRTHQTRVERGVTSYTWFDSDIFVPADGKPRPHKVGGNEGMIAIRCEGGAVHVSYQWDNAPAGDEPYWIWVKPVGADLLELQSMDAARSGIYRLQ